MPKILNLNEKTTKALYQTSHRLANSSGGPFELSRWGAQEGFQMVDSRSGLDRQTRAFLDAYGTIADEAMGSAFDNVPAFMKETVKLAACTAMHQFLHRTHKGEVTEAALSGVDLVTFTRQRLLTIGRTYVYLWATQLFGYLPMRGSTGRMFFKVYEYDSNYIGSEDTIAAGDATDEVFDSGYAEFVEASLARKIKFRYSDLDIAIREDRVSASWSDMFAEDAVRDLDDADPAGSTLNECARLIAQTIDQRLIAAALTDAFSGNNLSSNFDITPSDYASAVPSEKAEFRHMLFTHGFAKVVSNMAITNKNNPSIPGPDWLLVGPRLAYAMDSTKFYTSKNTGAQNSQYALSTGPIREVGMLDNYGVRVIVVPFLDEGLTTDQSRFLFGRRPTMANDPGIYLAMHTPLKITRDAYDPDSGLNTQAVRTRYGIVRANTDTNPDSAELQKPYGRGTVEGISGI